MKLQAEIVPKDKWSDLNDTAHVNVFGTEQLEDSRVFDFAVLVKNSDSQRVCYGTVKELDRDSAYLQYGGTFQDFRSQGVGYEGFHAIVEALKPKYKMLGFTTKTTNAPMIKLGLNEGFKIIGLREINGIPNIEFSLEGET